LGKHRQSKEKNWFNLAGRLTKGIHNQVFYADYLYKKKQHA
jgi:hypothetical protein